MANEYQNLLEDMDKTSADVKNLTDKTKSLTETMIVEVETEPIDIPD